MRSSMSSSARYSSSGLPKFLNGKTATVLSAGYASARSLSAPAGTGAGRMDTEAGAKDRRLGGDPECDAADSERTASSAATSSTVANRSSGLRAMQRSTSSTQVFDKSG